VNSPINQPALISSYFVLSYNQPNRNEWRVHLFFERCAPTSNRIERYKYNVKNETIL